jgi:predicted SAM-dependent methyltransferase
MNRVEFKDSNDLMVELGCGNKDHQREGYIHLDINDHGQDIVWDITKNLPFRDNSCIEIYSSHTFEHITRQDLIGLFNECWRVLKSSGVLWVVVPAWDSESRFIIPHYTQFDEATFKHLTGEMNPDYPSLIDMHSRGLRTWKTIELITNERPDIHWKAQPLKP